MSKPRIALPALFFFAFFAVGQGQTSNPDPGCETYQAWQIQGGVKSDAIGYRNVAYPEANATYWGTVLQLPAGTDMVIRGRFPSSRYTALQLYDSQSNVIDAIGDQDILPDEGQNNPYQAGTEAGTYTVRVVFGRKPRQSAPNTIYTNLVPDVLLLYRIYYPTDPANLAGNTGNPALPDIYQNGALLSTCPPRPIIQPEDNSTWGRLDNADFSGVRPATVVPASNPPAWVLSVTNPLTLFYPSKDNSYMTALVSRDYLKAPFNFDMVVVQFKAPTFANTHGGEPPYWANSTRQVRFWSVCTNEIQSTGVVRCAPDYQTPQRNGYATIVISDPSKRPTDAVLNQFGATWLPWGALLPGDTVYDIFRTPLDNSSGVFYQGSVMYRQTAANPSWDQSFTAVGQLPREQWKTAMGDYWPAIGYCRLSTFNQSGAGCIGPRR